MPELSQVESRVKVQAMLIGGRDSGVSGYLWGRLSEALSPSGFALLPPGPPASLSPPNPRKSHSLPVLIRALSIPIFSVFLPLPHSYACPGMLPEGWSIGGGQAVGSERSQRNENSRVGSQIHHPT